LYLLLIYPIGRKAVLLALVFTFSAKMKAGETLGSKKSSLKSILYGLASFYHNSLQGYHTFSGEHYLKNRLTAAHKTLPMDTDLRNYKTVIVQINDRLPKNSKRLINLSQRAASTLKMVGRGIERVKVEIMHRPFSQPALVDL